MTPKEQALQALEREKIRREKAGERVPQNPLKRLRQAAGLTLDRLAEEAEVSRQFIIRCEQGVYPEPSTKIAKALLRLSREGIHDGRGLDLTDITNLTVAYYHFQECQRRDSYGLLSLNTEVLRGAPGGVHPFVHWRCTSGLSSRIGVSKAFCVHPAVVTRFESQSHLVTHVPVDLLTALRNSGYSREILELLEDQFYAYKRYLGNRIRKASIHATHG